MVSCKTGCAIKCWQTLFTRDPTNADRCDVMCVCVWVCLWAKQSGGLIGSVWWMHVRKRSGLRSCDSRSVDTCAVKSRPTQRALTLYPLQLGAPESHGQVERDEVLVVTQSHQEVKLHLGQHLWPTGESAVRTQICKFWPNRILNVTSKAARGGASARATHLTNKSKQHKQRRLGETVQHQTQRQVSMRQGATTRTSWRRSRKRPSARFSSL